MGAVGKQKRTASATDDMLRYFVRDAKEGFVSVVMSCCALSVGGLLCVRSTTDGWSMFGRR